MRNDMELKIRLAMEECLSGMENRPSLENCVLERIQGRRRAPFKLSAAMALALLLTLLAAAALAVGAIAGWFRVEQSSVGAIQSCVSDGDTLYLLSTGGLYTWQTGQEEPALLLTDDALQEAGLSTRALLCMLGGEPALLHPESCSLWRIRRQTLQATGNYSGTILDNSCLCITAAVCAGDNLFIRAVPCDALPQEALLFRWQLSTGSMEQLPLSGVLELCPFDTRQVLVLHQESAANPLYQLSRLDAATGSMVETLYTTPVQGIENIMMHPKTGQIAAFVAGAPSLWNGSGWSPLQGYALSEHTDACAIVGSSIAAINFDNLQVIPFTTENSMTTLHIRGFMATNNEDVTFQQENPGIAVQREKDPYLNAAAVQQAIADGDTTDLFHLWLSWDLTELFRSGTLAQMPTSPLLEKDAESMLPVFREGISAAGKGYAVPSRVTVNVWESVQESPGDFTGLLEACMDNGWTKEQYAGELLKGYILAFAPGMPDFHLSAFAEALHALRNAALPEAGQTDPAAYTTTAILDMNGKPVIPPSPGKNSGDSAGEQCPQSPILWRVPTPVVPGAAPVVPARLSVYVLNPNAANPELALSYLESIATHRRPDTEALLKPSAAVPVLQPAVEDEIERLVENQRALDAGLGQETDEEALTRRVAAVTAAPEAWAVTEEKLRVYREQIVPCISLQLHPLLSGKAKEADGAYTQLLQEVLAFVNEECTLESCLQQLEAVLQHSIFD